MMNVVEYKKFSEKKPDSNNWYWCKYNQKEKPVLQFWNNTKKTFKSKFKRIFSDPDFWCEARCP